VTLAVATFKFVAAFGGVDFNTGNRDWVILLIWVLTGKNKSVSSSFGAIEESGCDYLVEVNCP
jgi:hypothetical protein